MTKVAIEASVELGMHSNWRGHSTPDTHLCRCDFVGTGPTKMFPEVVGSVHVSDTTSFVSVNMLLFADVICASLFSTKHSFKYKSIIKT